MGKLDPYPYPLTNPSLCKREALRSGELADARAVAAGARGVRAVLEHDLGHAAVGLGLGLGLGLWLA